MPVSTTLDHVTIVTDDFEASRPVYDALFSALGLVPTGDFEDPEAEDDDPGTVAAVGYATTEGRQLLWLVAGADPTVGAHAAFAVPTQELVRAAHRAAADAGMRVVQAPREWEADQLGYYGVQLADLAGNRLEVLLRT